MNDPPLGLEDASFLNPKQNAPVWKKKFYSMIDFAIPL